MKLPNGDGESENRMFPFDHLQGYTQISQEWHRKIVRERRVLKKTQGAC
jgi:hypothetical protein